MKYGQNKNKYDNMFNNEDYIMLQAYLSNNKFCFQVCMPYWQCLMQICPKQHSWCNSVRDNTIWK